MPDFDRTLKSFYIQDEPACKLVNLTSNHTWKRMEQGRCCFQ